MAVFSHLAVLGGLSEADRDRIAALAERGLGPGRIARALSRHPSTVRSFMTRQGLLQQIQRRNRPATFRHGDRIVHLFAPEHDALITHMRVEGHSLQAIAVAVSARFGIARSKPSIMSRLLALAAMEDA